MTTNPDGPDHLTPAPESEFHFPVAWQWGLSALAILGWIGLLLFKMRWLRHGGWQVDDSYMFVRYAMHMRHGLGMSWNLDGVHTYGMTSLLWTWIILPFTFLPGPTAIRLTLASWIFSGLGIAATTAAICRNARSRTLRQWWAVLPLVAFTFLMLPMFDYGSASGMETMLGLTLIAAFTGLVLAQVRWAIRPEWIGVTAVLLYWSRPESLLVAVLMIALSRFLVPGVTTRAILRAFAVLALGIGLTLLWGKLYFHSALPLPYYLKSRHPYIGYRLRWYPVSAGLTFLRTSALYLILLVCLVTRRTWRILLLTAIPLLAVSAYLCTVTQIMGFHSRYSLPYLPLLAIPAFLALDDTLAASSPGPRWGLTRLLALVLVGGFLAGLLPAELHRKLEQHAETRVLAYQDVVFDPPTKTAPPMFYFTALYGVANDLVHVLPRGATIASTEVGYLGEANPQLNIIDLAGLNDPDIAMHGFNPDALIARAPDLIWLAHLDYTHQRGTLLTDPAFLQHYELYANAFSTGIAIRKDSPYRQLLEHQLQTIWPKYYPGTQPSDFLVTHVTWPPGTYIPDVNPPSI